LLTEENTVPRKTYHGSCHCGNVRYAAAVDLSLGTAKCNCSICMKMRIWHVIFKAKHFSLLSNPELMGEYQWLPAGREKSRMHYFFCKTCGVPLFAWGDFPDGRYYAIQVTTLDDVESDELAAAPVKYEDGRHDRFDRVPTDIRLL
jgi:hypothetical protein